MYFTDRGIEELEQRRGDEEVTFDWLAEQLPARIPGLRTTVPEATYLMWLDFRDTVIPDAPADWLLRNARVALNEGSTFGPGGEGHARLNFACSRQTLTEAVDRIVRTLSRV